MVSSRFEGFVDNSIMIAWTPKFTLVVAIFSLLLTASIALLTLHHYSKVCVFLNLSLGKCLVGMMGV